MSTEPANPKRPIAPQDTEGTGLFTPPSPPTLDGPALPVPPATEGTGIYSAEDHGGTGVYAADSSQVGTGLFPANHDEPNHGGTGEYAPGESETGLFPANHDEPNHGGTGEYVPGASEHLPGTERNETLDFFDPAGSGTSGAGENAGGPLPRCGRYLLKRFHAKGGMGEIWLANDPTIGRSVALKRMLSHRPDQIRRFLVEAQVTGQLEHPGIVPIHELGTNEEGKPFYVMKFVNGRTLQKVIKDFHKAEMSPGAREVEQLRLLQILLSLCQTVGYAHSRGVLHRDLKPENVMLGPFGETLLLDWGIARVRAKPESPAEVGDGPAVRVQKSDSDTETQAGAIAGSPSYMAPESAAGLNEEIDEQSDVFLLGGILYEMLTGQMPRKATTVFEMIQLAQREAPKPPRSVNPQIPRALDAICLKAMAFRKEARYATALDLAEDIQRYVAGEPVSAYREGLLARTWRWTKRHRKILSWSAAAVLAVSLSLFGFAKYQQSEQRRAEAQRVAEELKTQDQARRDVKEFRRLADEARFYAATTDPVSENAPYFDPEKGDALARAAREVAVHWGPALEQLPLPEEIDSVKKDLYDLLLLMAQSRSQSGAKPEQARETLELLADAAHLRTPSRGFYRLRAAAHQRSGDAKLSGEDQKQANDPRTPAAGLDSFLLGEQYRKEAARRKAGATQEKAWKSDPRGLVKAIAQYRLALAADPDHYWSHFQLGRCYLSLGRFAEAVEAMGACIALRPEAPWGYSVRGLAHAQQKHYPEAFRDLNRAVQLSPDSRPARLNRGVIYWSQKKHDEALADFAFVLQPPAEKRLVEAAFYRGQLYLQLGKVDKALEDFDRVAAEKPGFQPVYAVRARIRIARGKTAAGLEDLDRSLSVGGRDDRPGWEVHGRRGKMLRLMHAEVPQDQQRKPSARALAALAVEELRKAVLLGARNPEVFDDLGAMLALTGQLKEAIAAYGQGLKLAPKHVRLLIKRAWMHDQLNQREQALADFTAAIKVDPENAEAHTGLGYLRAVEKLAPSAQQAADLALLHGADNYMILHNVACIYATLSETRDAQATANQDVAIALLKRAIKLWKQAGTGPNEIDLIKGDSAFRPLRERRDFQELIRGGAPGGGK